MKKRILSILLTLVMVIGMLPTVAFAAGPSGATWEGNTAKWNAVSGAGTYSVILYKDGTALGGTKTSGTSYDFSGMMNIKGNGSYTFVVSSNVDQYAAKSTSAANNYTGSKLASDESTLLQSLSIGGTTYRNDDGYKARLKTNMSGTGWTYSEDDHEFTITLTSDYNGEEIYATNANSYAVSSLDSFVKGIRGRIDVSGDVTINGNINFTQVREMVIQGAGGGNNKLTIKTKDDSAIDNTFNVAYHDWPSNSAPFTAIQNLDLNIVANSLNSSAIKLGAKEGQNSELRLANANVSINATNSDSDIKAINTVTLTLAGNTTVNIDTDKANPVNADNYDEYPNYVLGNGDESGTIVGALNDEYYFRYSDNRTNLQIVPVRLVNSVSVSANWSGTPTAATSSTTGIAVIDTKWYKQNGSGWTQLTASNTISAGGTYRCEVTVAATNSYYLANEYTVKINGIAATKKSGNTWYVDKTITGEINYIDVVDILLPEVGARPDLDCDIESSNLDASKLKIEWFACDKDGKYITGTPLDATHLYQENTYYRVNVTVYAKENYVFDGQDLSAWINWKAANYYYNKDSSVTMFTVYHVDEVIGTYTVQIGDITLKDGEYLANNATAVSTSMPSGGYAYYNDGVLTLNNFVSKQLVRYDERFLEVELIGENEIGAIADYYYWDTTSNDYYTSLEFRGSGNLKMITYCDPASQISVNGDVFFNGSGYIYIDAELSCFQYVENVIVNDGYVFFACSQFRIFADDTNLAVNGGKVELFNGGSWDSTYICNGTFNITAGDVFVGSNRAKLEDCDPWDGTTDLNKYDTVWIVNVPTYQVIFIGADDTVLDIVRVKEGRTVARPANPEDPLGAGRTFLGWYTDDGELFDFDTPITEKTYLTAKFKDLTITGSATNGIKVAVESFSGSATLMVAQYNDGKMVDVQTKAVTADGTYTMNELTHKTGCTYKAFLVNSTTYAPLCEADEF